MKPRSWERNPGLGGPECTSVLVSGMVTVLGAAGSGVPGMVTVLAAGSGVPVRPAKKVPSLSPA